MTKIFAPSFFSPHACAVAFYRENSKSQEVIIDPTRVFPFSYQLRRNGMNCLPSEVLQIKRVKAANGFTNRKTETEFTCIIENTIHVYSTRKPASWQHFL